MAKQAEEGVWIPLDETLEEMLINGILKKGDLIEVEYTNPVADPASMMAKRKILNSSNPEYVIVKPNAINPLIGA